MQKITFYLPSRIYGGAERQMALLAICAADQGYKVEFIDSKKGIIADLLKDNKNIKIITEDVSGRISVKDSILITQASYAFCISSMLNITNCDVRFWFMHSLNLPDMHIMNKLPIGINKIYSLFFKNFYKENIKKFKSSFYFMGDDIKETVQDNYEVKFERNSTGMLSEVKPPNHHIGTSNLPSNKSIVWLGRLDKSSKFITVKKLIDDFSRSKKIKQNYIFEIVGDGESKKELIQYVKSLKIEQSVIFHGNVDYQALPKFISKAKVLFAHGTSVYEGVNNDIPVCLIDFYTKEDHLKNMNYEFYFEHKSNGFGSLINENNKKMITRGQAFDQLLEQACQNPKEIIEKQRKKLTNFLNISEDRCKILFANPEYGKHIPKSFMVDVLFFSIRNFLIKS